MVTSERLPRVPDSFGDFARRFHEVALVQLPGVRLHLHHARPRLLGGRDQNLVGLVGLLGVRQVVQDHGLAAQRLLTVSDRSKDL